MTKITRSATAYKRGSIRSLAPFFESGLITASELEYIANGAVLEAFKEWGSK